MLSKRFFNTNKNLQLPTWIIAELKPNYNFLNQQQKDLVFKMSNQSEEFTATFDTNFNLFSIDNIGFESFPPLNNLFGNVTVNGATTTLLGSKIRAIDAGSPLLMFNNQSPRIAYLMGEEIFGDGECKRTSRRNLLRNLIFFYRQNYSIFSHHKFT